MAFQVDEKFNPKHDGPALEPPSIDLDASVRPEDPVSVEERRLVRKLDRRILPITCLLYLFACQCFGHFYVCLLDPLPQSQTWTEVIWVTLVYRA